MNEVVGQSHDICEVIDQFPDANTFQDQGSAHATLEAACICNVYGCIPGYEVKIADAEQEYVQAAMRGTDTCICLPEDQRPLWWEERCSHIHRPVCRLNALHGHPHAGTLWEERADEHYQRVGFAPIGLPWPGCCFHQPSKLFLVISIDDFTLASPTVKIKKGWALLHKEGTGLDIRSGVSIPKTCNRSLPPCASMINLRGPWLQ